MELHSREECSGDKRRIILRRTPLAETPDAQLLFEHGVLEQPLSSNSKKAVFKQPLLHTSHKAVFQTVGSEVLGTQAKSRSVFSNI
jgi:hypothetical protein